VDASQGAATQKSAAVAPEFRSRIEPDRLRISETARAELEKIFAERPGTGLIGVRLFVTGGGCSGMKYAMTFTDRQLEHDRVLRCGSFDIFVDGIAFHHVFRATGGSGLCGGCIDAGS
jgi:Fe-S cluster assembly iron-binding protein IscA